MSAPFFVPFNFQPTATGRTTGTYTVPSGKYARVLVAVGLSATASSTSSTQMINASTGPASYTVCPGAISETIELWIKAGDAVTFSTSQASGSASISTSSTSGVFIDSHTASTTCTINLNGSSVAVLSATATASISTFNSSATSVTGTYATFSGSADVVISYSEFNEIT